MKRILVCLICATMVITFLGCGAPTKAVGAGETLLEASTEETVEESIAVTIAVDKAESSSVSITPTEPVETLPQYKEYEYFNEDFFYEVDYIENGEVIPHLLFEPDYAQDYEKLPLVIWLHGSGQKAAPVDNFKLNSLRKGLSVAAFYGYESFNAYFVAPHLVRGDFWTPYWCTEDAAKYITDLIDYYVEHYNVDPNQVALAGHSLGGQGVAYLPQVLPDTFCAAAPLSVYHPCIPLTNKDIPMWCFRGQTAYGEDSVSNDYAFSTFKNFYGEDSITSLPVGHGELPLTVFSLDNDSNMRLDILEWMAEHMSNNATRHTEN